MNYKTILFDIERDIARLTLNRPEVLNSFNGEMHDEVREAFAVAASTGARVLVLAGSGKAFCAGQDLRDRAALSEAEGVDLGESLERNFNPLVLAIHNMRMPVIAAVNGVAAGAGANIALACDIVVAARSAKFVQSFAKLGLVPDSGGTWSLPRLVGQARALGLTLLGDSLPAEQAAAWGMIWQCVDDELFEPTVEALASRCAVAPTRGIAATKQAIRGGGQCTLTEQLDVERDLQRDLGRSSDYREGVAAFMAKRAPLFRGR